MSSKTVVTYSEEFDSDGIGGKKARTSVFIPLICSIVAAFALWLFVVWGNNTCTGIPVQVLGNEQLMSNNYTVSSIDPANIDLVFRGKSDVIKRISKDPSLVTAYVNVFGTEGDDPSTYIFNDVSEIAPGEYTVELKITVPEGVSCSAKSVKVTISEAGSKEFSTSDLSESSPVRLQMSNYSFANGVFLDKIVVMEERIVVIGDQRKVNDIESISLKVDWLNDISDDATIYVTPVACDKYGDVIDSEFLRFEPASVKVNVKVNKQKIVHLVPLKADGDSAEYSLSVDTVTVFGPVLEIDKLKDVYEIPVAQELDKKNYTIKASDFGGNLKFVNESGEDAITVVVQKKQRTVRETISVKAEDLLLISAPDFPLTFDKDEYLVEVCYVVIDSSVSTSVVGNAVVTLDLSKLEETPGGYQLSMNVAFSPNENVERIVSVSAEKVTVTVLEKSGE